HRRCTRAVGAAAREGSRARLTGGAASVAAGYGIAVPRRIAPATVARSTLAWNAAAPFPRELRRPGPRCTRWLGGEGGRAAPDRRGELGFARRADRQDLARPRRGRHVEVAHAAVEVDRVAGLEPRRRVELGVQLDGTLEHVGVLLAGMPDPVAELV